jgi:hypothetical protein
VRVRRSALPSNEGDLSMQQKSRRLTKIISVLGVLALAGLGMPRAGTADEVFDWNVTGFEATAEGGQNPILISRTMTMMHLAVHDALNAIERRYEPYLYEGRAETIAAPGAAVAAAAHDVLVEVIPGWGKPEQREKALGVNAVSIFLTCAEVKFPRRRVTVISRRCDQGLHFCVGARGGAAAVPGSAS